MKYFYTLSDSQKSIWLTEKMYKNTNINNICGTLFFREKVNIELLEKAVRFFVAKNKTMNIRISEQMQYPQQYLCDKNDFDIEIKKIKDLQQLKALENTIANEVINIIDSRLFRFYLFQLPDETGGVISNLHHLVADAWSFGLMATQIKDIYESLVFKTDMLEDKPSYLEYVKSQEEYENTDKYKKNQEYWENTYNNIPDLVTLKLYKNKEVKLEAKRKEIKLSKEKTKQINEFAKENKTSIFSLFMAIFSIYLSRVSNNDDVIIGTPFLNRTNFIEKNTMGMFVNTLPNRIKINWETEFKNFISEVARTQMTVLRHQKYPYNKLLEKIRKEQGVSRNLYDIVLSYQNARDDSKNSKIEYTTNWTFNSTIANSMEIHFFDMDDSGELQIYYDYQINKFSDKEVEDIHNRIIYILEQVMLKDVKLEEIKIVTPKEEKQLLCNFNKKNEINNKSINEIFENQVSKSPDDIAVVFENKSLTYKELNEKVNSFANYLKEKNIGKNDIVGLCVNRSLEVVIGMLGVLKAGAAYLPIDPEYPRDRIEYMLNDSNCKLIFIQKETENKFNFNGTKVNITSDEIYNYKKSNFQINENNEDLAYLIYTSGSTGLPKGAMLKRKGLKNLIYAMNEIVEYDKVKSIVAVGTISFDITILEITIPLMFGMKVVVANNNQKMLPNELEKLIDEQDIEMIAIVPSRMEMLLNNNCRKIKKLKKILLGGEAFSSKLYERIKELTNTNIDIYNAYGPTEITVASNVARIKSKDNVSIIGKPLTNVTEIVLDKNMQMLPLGIAGELFIGGEGLFKGYINNEKLTSEKIVDWNGHKLYKTGDVVLINENEEIDYLGRNDNQIKLRGLRIELGEIENKILEYSGISSCVVDKKENEGREFLCAYIVGEKVEIQDLREFLNKSSLPYYMIPQYFVQLEQFMYLPNGKIDKKSLPLPEIRINQKLIKPRNEFDEKLLNIFEEIFEINSLSIEDSFFEIGGDSLIAIQLSCEIQDKLKVQITVQDLFNMPTIKELSDYIKTKMEIENEKIETVENREYYLTSTSEQRIYLASMMDENSLVYNMPGKVLLYGKLNISKLEKSLNTIIEEQEILRTSFSISKNGEIISKIKPTFKIKLEIQKCNEKNTEEYIKEFVKPFNLEQLPLFRLKILEINSEKHIMLFDMHHIISDGTSMDIFLNRLKSLYNGGSKENFNISYKDYSNWENNRIKNDKLQQEENYWISKFAKEEITTLDLLTDYKRPLKRGFRGNKIYSKLDYNLYTEIQKICDKYNVTPFMFFLSVYYILLSRYSGQDEIIIGAPIANRTRKEFQNIMGVFINEMPIKMKLVNESSFPNFIGEVKNNSLEAMNNAEFPFNKIIEKLNVKKDTSRNPLYDVMFVYQNMGGMTLDFDELRTEIEYLNNNYSKLDLSLEIIPYNNQYSISFEYCTDLFKKSTIESMKNHYINIIKELVKNPNISIGDIEILSEDEKNKLLYKFNDTKTEYSKEKTVNQLFEEQVKKTPNNIALISNGIKLTYKELNERANQLANYIKQNYNIQDNNIIGLMTKRTVELIIGQMAILKAGGCYLPIDPNYPKDRIEYILQNSNTKLILTNIIENNIEYKECNVVDICLNNNKIYDSKDINNLKCGNTSNLCYMIYTSGSTGKPKGVMITHLNVNNFIIGLDTKIDFKNKTIVSVTTMSFDIFVLESLLALTQGTKIILANEDEQNIPELLNKLCIENNVNMIQTTPSRYGLLLSDNKKLDYFSKMTDIISGGEPITERLLSKFKKISNARIYNIYGPTETTVWSTMVELTERTRITIGKPIANTNIYILNKNKKIIPIGAVGEIYIGGDGVSKGYYNNKDLTNQKFIINPYNKNEIIYATGDLGKWLSNGEIECLGRNDNQIKISGNRVELSEIEKAILRIKGISNTVVVLKEDNTNRHYLCAYVVSNERIKYSDVREVLSKTLPTYMIPTQLVQLEKIPYTPNGKINKLELPNPENINIDKKEYIAPTTPIQKELVNIFEELLPVRPISVDDNFFEIGGDSLLAMQLQIKLLNIGKQITYGDLYTNPSIIGIERIITNDDKFTMMTKQNDIDYDSFKHILENNLNMPQEFIKHSIGNILLTGVTGYLGSHILEYFIKNYKGKIYCIIRRETGRTPEEKLISTLEFYFEGKYKDLVNERIFIVESDFTKDNLALSEESYSELADKVDWVINSAAKVTHYGNYKDFEKINVKGTKQLVDFCIKFNKKLFHISTMSVSGNTLAETYETLPELKRNYIYTEKDFYIKQSLENVYVKTKFEAEAIILNAINKGLDAYIGRMGNLTNRYIDGKFQKNIKDNAFMNRVKAFSEIGFIPENLYNEYMELTPVDKASKAIIMLMMYANKQNRIFHIYNNKYVSVKEFVNILKNVCNKDITVISDEIFNKRLKEILITTKSKKIIEGIATDLNQSEMLKYESNVKLNCDFTTDFLNKVNFEWNEINTSYLNKVFKYLKEIGYME
ncbi:MAG: amino acid adenylation domain-containing protein [Clostridia bacterium]|nr:amino acid adenylation domain-containing protein [Clostridia bacterium]